MGAMKAVALSLDEQREELIIRLAEMAGILRRARRAGAAVPVLCLLDCDPQRWIRWGREDRCTNCGTPAVSADTWHCWLTQALRESSSTGRRAA